MRRDHDKKRKQLVLRKGEACFILDIPGTLYTNCYDSRPTCGTHFGETKLVASMTGSPDSDNRSISWILVSVGTRV